MKKILCKQRVEASNTTAYCMAGHFPIDCSKCDNPDKSYIDIETITIPVGEEDNSCILLYGLDGRQVKQTPDEIQKVINENFLDMIGEDSGDKLISLNKACEWWRTHLPFIYLSGMNKTGEHKIINMHIENFKKAMEQ